ncbi:hypothetical protein L6164_003956 [Bauhinia variegata]|uniref:Uncharacterized protein n=1 Tax=Bauhinia variegata TaxID=167791 RepID=A0ACB9Q344_BAUVA|nr:hypothetical protein L6164_003956 [Bauhinia variegata]
MVEIIDQICSQRKRKTIRITRGEPDLTDALTTLNQALCCHKYPTLYIVHRLWSSNRWIHETVWRRHHVPGGVVVDVQEDLEAAARVVIGSGVWWMGPEMSIAGPVIWSSRCCHTEAGSTAGGGGSGGR